MRMYVIVGLLIGLFWAQPGKTAEVMRSHFPVRAVDQLCHDVNGQRVATIRFDGLRDVAHAVILNQIPYIVLNPVRLATLPPKLQAFFFDHECAHHIMGHNYNPTLESEPEADCLAVKLGRENRLFTRADIESFRPWIVPLRGSLRGHLPGNERQVLLERCFDDSEEDPELRQRMTQALDATSRFRGAQSNVLTD